MMEAGTQITCAVKRNKLLTLFIIKPISRHDEDNGKYDVLISELQILYGLYPDAPINIHCIISNMSLTFKILLC